MSMFEVPCVTIESITKHPNADALEIISFNEIGWVVIDKLGKRKIGDKVLYIPVDAKVPVNIPEFEFLSENAKSDGYARIKTVKLRGIFSQGLIIDANDNMIVGNDYKDELNIIKYVPAEECALNMPRGGSRFPAWARKTDAERYQNIKNFVKQYSDNNWIATIKIDGTSSSFGYSFENDEELLCSRNLNISKKTDSFYHTMNSKYNLIENIKNMALNELRMKYNNITNIMIQGEIAGPTIQKNRLGLKELDFFAFDIFIVSETYTGYLNYFEFLDLCEKYKIPTVPVFNEKCSLPSIEEALNIVNNLKYNNGHPIEGLVFILTDDILNKNQDRIKLKIISQEFELKINKK